MALVLLATIDLTNQTTYPTVAQYAIDHKQKYVVSVTNNHATDALEISLNGTTTSYTIAALATTDIAEASTSDTKMWMRRQGSVSAFSANINLNDLATTSTTVPIGGPVSLTAALIAAVTGSSGGSAAIVAAIQAQTTALIGASSRTLTDIYNAIVTTLLNGLIGVSGKTLTDVVNAIVAQNVPSTSAAVTPGDATVVAFKALWVGTLGNLSVKLTNDAAATTWKNIPSGTMVVGNFIRVMAATTATDIVGLS